MSIVVTNTDVNTLQNHNNIKDENFQIINNIWCDELFDLFISKKDVIINNICTIVTAEMIKSCNSSKKSKIICDGMYFIKFNDLENFIITGNLPYMISENKYGSNCNLIAYYELNKDLHNFEFIRDGKIILQHYMNSNESENRKKEYDDIVNAQNINWYMYRNPLKAFQMYIRNKSLFLEQERCFLNSVKFVDCSLNENSEHIMFVSHPGGGGVEKHLNLMTSCCKKWFLVRSNCHMNNIIEFVHNEKVQYFHESNINDLYILCVSMGIKLIINNHLYIFSTQVMDMILRLKQLYNCQMITLGHDMTLLCPNIHDMRVRKRVNKYYINARKMIIDHSCELICPSIYLLRKYNYHFKITCKLLNITEIGNYQIKSRSIQKDNIFHIVVLGAFKGDEEMKIFLDNTNYIIDFFGYTTIKHERLIDYGPYNDDEIVTKIRKIDPHLIWFPSKKPETFCYALSYAIDAGYPIIATNQGAMTERLKDIPHSILIEQHIKLHTVIDDILKNLINSIANYNAIRHDRKLYMTELLQLCNVSDISELLCDY